MGLKFKFASPKRAVHNRHPHMLTENPTELLTELLTETDRTFDRWVLKSSGQNHLSRFDISPSEVRDAVEMRTNNSTSYE